VAGYTIHTGGQYKEPTRKSRMVAWYFQGVAVPLPLFFGICVVKDLD
jgi:hypothetical protein